MKIEIKIVLFVLLTFSLIVSSQELRNPTYDKFIQGQIELRNKELKKSLDSFVDLKTQKDPGAMYGITTVLNGIAAGMGIVGFGPGAAVATLVRIVIGCIDQKLQQDASKKTAQKITDGISLIVDNKLSSYDVATLKSILQGTSDDIEEFNHYYRENITNLEGLARTIHNGFIHDMPQFKKTYEEISLFTLFANSHLAFLVDIYTYGKGYGISDKERDFYYNEYKTLSVSYMEYITRVNKDVLALLETKISGSNVEKFNKRNQIYNWMQVYVYDFSNYWWALDTKSYPKGVLIENAKVTISDVIGTYRPSDIQGFIDKNGYQMYNGKQTQICYRQNYCFGSYNFVKYYKFDLLKYLGGQYQDIHVDSQKPFSIGNKHYDKGSENVFENKKDENVICTDLPMNIETVDLAIKNEKDMFPAETLFGFNINKQKLGYWDHYNNDVISYPNKVLAQVIPMNFQSVSLKCMGGDRNSEHYTITSVVFTFVSQYVSDKNIIVQDTTNLMDAQKYSSASTFNYLRDGIASYLGGVSVPKEIIYQISFTSIDSKPRRFNIQLWTASSKGETVTIQTFLKNTIINTFSGQLTADKNTVATVDLPSESNQLLRFSFSLNVIINSVIFDPVR
ncbi:hypothetical protein DLAC_04167 [Tieghemostelium lacteum]|uniref:Pesticidal crystal protein domain-containing protein n=1 Tax=Tieghemostelium lacteum TaxID=361077 RepID=A0A151ZSF1_TIELA|nr:hypothetical protein DLAC_04167 [Tieghemostelium lacteum]|eukprot:KYQ96860.1 hypothetical protein DLAC_04167 [Tieghemostelium lacteum]